MGSSDQGGTTAKKGPIVPEHNQLGTQLCDDILVHSARMEMKPNPRAASCDQHSPGGSCSKQALKQIEKVKMSSGLYLDLSRQNLTCIPDEMMDLRLIEFVYLEGNHIKRLPNTFFDDLPNLKWLDLRHNDLVHLPCTYIARHANLQTLLLQDNKLRTLPLELGLVRNLKGLSLSGNPLEFPPESVIDSGTKEVLKYLKAALVKKAKGEELFSDSETKNQLLSCNGDDEDGDYCSSDDESRGRATHSAPRQRHNTLQEDNDSEFGVQSKSASLHKPISYYQIRQQHNERVKRAGATGKVDKMSEKFWSGKKPSRHLDISRFPAPPPASLIDDKVQEEARIRRIKRIKQKQESILQRRRNDEVLKDFRSDAKNLQNQKYRQVVKKGEAGYDDTAAAAPYGYDDDYDRVLDREQLHKHEVKLAHDRMSRPLSPATLHQMEQKRAERDKELDRKVKSHTDAMIQRRKLPRGTPSEELEAAKRELEIGVILETELRKRRKELEYRFKAFTGDTM